MINSSAIDAAKSAKSILALLFFRYASLTPTGSQARQLPVLLVAPHFSIHQVGTAGHPLLNQIRSKTETVSVQGIPFHVILSYNKVAGIDGYVIGLKFSDAEGSMDSAKAKQANGIQIALAIAHRAVQMLTPDLHSISILGFYLLTDEIEARRPGGSRLKVRLYSSQAAAMHQALQHKLQHLSRFTTEGGVAWVLSEHPHANYGQFNALKSELAKQIRTTLC
ncbi:hypothetical protein V8J88_03255 [Massilia sp. W12]|uniref:hypothetical protein n=1 Tax=Massilia sp. W12 TaxID=3126507 RepID=UPI0030CF0D66